jgi:hypothetical protein
MMSVMTRFRFSALVLGTFIGLWSTEICLARSDGPILSSPSLHVNFRDVSRVDAETFVVAATKARESIESYLDRRYDGRISISIGDDHDFPRLDVNTDTIIIPANRIRGDAKGPPGLKGRGTAIVAVMTRLIAPSRNRDWGTFLETGLGVFLQEKFGNGEDVSFPNMGRDLHRETGRLAAQFGRFIPLADAERARTVRKRLNRTRRLAYLEEGSFARFLVETEGIGKFMRFYDGEPVEKVYAVDFASLERSWRNLIRSLTPEEIPDNNLN